MPGFRSSPNSKSCQETLQDRLALLERTQVFHPCPTLKCQEIECSAVPCLITHISPINRHFTHRLHKLLNPIPSFLRVGIGFKCGSSYNPESGNSLTKGGQRSCRDRKSTRLNPSHGY